MRVFLSWSGERSRAIAELLDEWLQCVIQAVNPWMSSKDIDRGSLWFSEITDQLQNTSVGILCLTQENKVKPWILFEAGALAKGLSSSRVCTFLIDLQPSDISNPLAQFNHTMPDKDSVWELVRTLNTSLKELALKENILDQVFETYWPQFDRKFKTILTDTPSSSVEEIRPQNEILSEILSSTRTLERRLSKLERVPHRPEPMRPDDARNIINQLFIDGLPEEAILDICKSQGIPLSYAKKVYSEAVDAFIQSPEKF